MRFPLISISLLVEDSFFLWRFSALKQDSKDPSKYSNMPYQNKQQIGITSQSGRQQWQGYFMKWYSITTQFFSEMTTSQYGPVHCSSCTEKHFTVAFISNREFSKNFRFQILADYIQQFQKSKTTLKVRIQHKTSTVSPSTGDETKNVLPKSLVRFHCYGTCCLSRIKSVIWTTDTLDFSVFLPKENLPFGYLVLFPPLANFFIACRQSGRGPKLTSELHPGSQKWRGGLQLQDLVPLHTYAN